jgi:hypothetical protein
VPPTLLSRSSRSDGGRGGEGIHDEGKALFGAGVVLEGKWSAEEVEEAPFKEGGQHRNVKSQRWNWSVGAVLLQ